MHKNDLHGVGPLRVIERPQPRNILIPNPKGGCGKTTLATNLAAYVSKQGLTTALMDFDPQGSSAYWLELRPENASPIAGIAAFSQHHSTKTRSFHNRLPRGFGRSKWSSPAGLSGDSGEAHSPRSYKNLRPGTGGR